MFSWLLSSLSTIKYYAIAALVFALVIAYALLQSEKKGRAQDKLKNMKVARETERRVNKATMNGLKNEQKDKNDIDITDDDKLI